MNSFDKNSIKEKLENQEKKLTQQQEELSKKNAEVVVELQKVAGLTKEEAKDPFDEKRTLCGHVLYQDNTYTFIENTSQCVTIE